MLQKQTNGIFQQLSTQADETASLGQIVNLLKNEKGLFIPDIDACQALIRFSHCGIALNKLFQSGTYAFMFRDGTNLQDPECTPVNGMPRELNAVLTMGSILLKFCNNVTRDYLDILRAHGYPREMTDNLVKINHITQIFYTAATSMQNLIRQNVPKDGLLIAHLDSTRRAMWIYYKNTRRDTKPYFDKVKATARLNYARLQF